VRGASEIPVKIGSELPVLLGAAGKPTRVLSSLAGYAIFIVLSAAITVNSVANAIRATFFSGIRRLVVRTTSSVL
jgi:hypothetical protein